MTPGDAQPWARFEALTWRLADDPPARVHYLPDRPTATPDDAGRPSLRMLQAGGAAHLQLTAQWDPAPEVLERLRAHAALRTGLAAALVSISPPPIVVQDATLLAGERELQTAISSGFPPFTVVFSLGLDADAAAAAQAAVGGVRGRLSVRFRAWLAGAPLVRVADVAGWLRSGTSHQVSTVVATEHVAALGRDRTAGPPPAQQ